METKFTPGPWEIKPIEDGKEYIRIRGTIPGSRFKIANVNDSKNHHDKDAKWCYYERVEAMANAHLMAASPEMYKEIQSDINNLRSILMSLDLNSLESAATEKKIARKEKLLAKARGEHV